MLKGQNQTIETQTQDATPVIPNDTSANPAVDQKPEEKKEDILSPKFAALARKEKLALQRLDAAKKKEADLIAREAKIKELEEKYSKKPANPVEALMQYGYSYKDATDFILNNQSLTAEQQIKAVKDEIASLRSEQAEKEKLALKTAEENAQSEYQQVIDNFKSEITDYIKENAENYELIELNDAHEIVFDTIQSHFEKTKKILSKKEASDLVEQYLLDQVEAIAQKSKKLQSKFKPAQAEQKDSKPAPAPAKTLSNDLASSVPSSLPAKTESERLQRALAALER